MRVPRAVAKFNRRITNPLAVRLGVGVAERTLEHVGRCLPNLVSGRTADGLACIERRYPMTACLVP